MSGVADTPRVEEWDDLRDGDIPDALVDALNRAHQHGEINGRHQILHARKGKEVVWLHQIAGIRAQARQRLVVAHLALRQTDDRLQMNFDTPGLDRIADELLHGCVVDAHKGFGPARSRSCRRCILAIGAPRSGRRLALVFGPFPRILRGCLRQAVAGDLAKTLLDASQFTEHGT